MSSKLNAFNSHKLCTLFSDDGKSYIHTIPSSTSPGGLRIETWCRVKDVGEGANGKVHKESCRENGTVRAVKVMKKATNSEAAFIRELSTLVRMSSHPDHFVQLFGWFEDEANYYIAMEYMECGDLHSMITHGLTIDQIKAASRQLLLGLDIMHNLGFCHRDLKPKNILIAKWFPLTLKIADFGTTKIAGAGTPLTTFTGTPDYLAPEILYSMNIDSDTYEYTKLVDIWSLGCVVYTMATKHAPFPGNQGLTQYTSGQSPFPDKGLEAGMRRFIMSLMRPLPQDRPTATEALTDPWLHPGADTWPWPIGGGPQSGDTWIHLDATRPTYQNEKVIEAPPHLQPNAATIRSQIYRPRWIVPTKPDMRALSLQGQIEVIKPLKHQRIGRDEKSLQLGIGRSEPELALVASDIKGKPLSGGKIKPSPHEQIKLRSRGDALIEGAANGRSNIVQSMLERGADISHKDRNGDTALHRAIQNGHKDIALFLLHRGADKMAKGFGGATPFILAARCGFLELVKLLLNDASDLLATDSNGFTALHVASQNKRRDVVSFILGLNAEDQLEVSTDRDKISTGVPVISRWAQVVHVVLEMRVGPYGFTALHSAASTGDYKTVQLLLKGGADVSSRAGDNSTPLTVSATDGHYRIVELLLDQGADISERGHHEYTALHLAAEVGHTNVVALLLERGADITAKEDRGYTPLQRAAASGFDTIVEKLISRVDMGNSTKAVTPARVHSSPPATEWAKKEDPSIPTAGRNTYTMIEVVKRSIMKRSEIQQSHQSITITRQTDQHASRIELRGSLGGKINGSKTAAGVAGKPVNESKLLERVENSTTHEELLSGTKQISGEPETHLQKIQMSKANAKSKRQQGTRKRVGKILKRSCVVS